MGVLLLLGECGGVSVCPILICLLSIMYWYGKYRKLGIRGILGDVVWCLIIFVGSGSYFLVNMHKIRKIHNSICVCGWWCFLSVFVWFNIGVACVFWLFLVFLLYLLFLV